MVSLSVGWSADEIREFVHQYELQPIGTKRVWREAQGVTERQIRSWRRAFYEGDVDHRLVPREAGVMTSSQSERRASQRAYAAERAAYEAQVAALQERVRLLESSNEALGKAIGLLHELRVPEPDAAPTMKDRNDS